MGLAQSEQKIPYPKSVFFIISNEFCERFSYYGMRTVLILYLRNILLFTESDSKIIYHVFTMLVYFFPLFGAIISDSYLGKFRTIFYLSIIYSCGNILLAVASAEPIGLPQVPFSLLGLLLIAMGTGGIKPCVSAFGGDQFVLPQQDLQLAAFFSMYYFSINAGSLISTFSTPLIRKNVHCFGEDSCYPLAYAIPGFLMIISIVIFVAGKPLYKIRKPEGNVMVEVSKCISHGIKKKFSASDKVDHWLDRAESRYGPTLVSDIKALLKVLVVFIPLPIFWALYDQQGSGWTFQATRMDGSLGSYTILPDQMQVVNPLLILAFIPLFTYGVYPLLAQCRILRTPLQRMVCGGLITALSFGMSAGVSFALEATYPVLPSAGSGQVRIYNTLDCTAQLNTASYLKDASVGPLGYQRFEEGIQGTVSLPVQISGCGPATGNLTIVEQRALFYFIHENGFDGAEDDIDKSENGLPRVRTLVNRPNSDKTLVYLLDGGVELEVNATDQELKDINPGSYKLEGSDEEVSFYLGGVYTVLVVLDTAGAIQKVALHEITQPNSVHMLWLIPQYLVITAGEIMFSITGLEFSYSQAPVSMKSVLTAAFLLTTAIGNLIIVIIESAKIFEKQSHDFLLYTGLMVVDMVFFAFLAVRYKYVEKEDGSEEEELQKTQQPQKTPNAIDNPMFKPNDDL